VLAEPVAMVEPAVLVGQVLLALPVIELVAVVAEVVE
jgi:hypothetical protein